MPFYKKAIEEKLEALEKAGNSEDLLSYISDEFLKAKSNPHKRDVQLLLIGKYNDHIRFLSIEKKIEGKKIRKLMQDYPIEFGD